MGIASKEKSDVGQSVQNTFRELCWHFMIYHCIIYVSVAHSVKRHVHTCDIFLEPDREIWDFSEGDWGLR